LVPKDTTVYYQITVTESTTRSHLHDDDDDDDDEVSIYSMPTLAAVAALVGNFTGMFGGARMFSKTKRRLLLLHSIQLYTNVVVLLNN
jgi:hypothetical protein